MNATQVKNRAIRYYADATDEQRVQGERWYWDATDKIDTMLHKADDPVNYREAARMAAILSPRCRWDRNLKALEQVLNGEKVTIPGILHRSIKLAESVKEGRWGLSGPKVTQFYKALIGDEDAVPVDSWMSKAFGGNGAPRAKEHKSIQAGIRRAALELDISPRTLQATVWVVVRGRSE
jgi:hypothetical protein